MVMTDFSLNVVGRNKESVTICKMRQNNWGFRRGFETIDRNTTAVIALPPSIILLGTREMNSK